MRINRAFQFLREDENRFIILKGGSGSGKSYSLAQHIFLSLINPNTNTNWLILRKFATTIQHSIFRLLTSIIEEENAVDYFNINKTLKIITSSCGGWATMLGLDDREKIKSIHGIDKIWIEEASEFSREDFIQLNLRLRGKGEKKQYYLSFNPVDSDHWLKEYFFDTEKPSTTIHHSTYQDNKFLDLDYTTQLEALKEVDLYYYNVYCLGEWGSLSSTRVLNNIKIHDFDYDENTLNNVCHGVDFGYINASTFVSLGFKENDIYIFNELYFTKLTNSEFIKELIENGVSKNINIVADSVEPARIQDFRNNGFKMFPSIKGAGSLKNGVDFLKNYCIHIHKTNCPNASLEFPKFKYKELRSGVITDDYVEVDDHTIAAVRYATEFLWNKKKKKKAPMQIRDVNIGSLQSLKL